MVITTTDRLAGAIHSLTWNGQEFINSFDHGRQLQSASSFNNDGECYNPTEAGSSADGTGNTSTSELLCLEASGNQLKTHIQMAFWAAAGATQPNCGTAINTTNTSNHILDVSGKLVRSIENINGTQVSIPRSNLSSGLCFVELVGDKRARIKMVVQ